MSAPIKRVAWQHRRPAEEIRFSRDRDALIHDLWVAGISASKIHAQVSELPGLPITPKQVSIRAGHSKAKRPSGYVDVEACRRSASNPASQAALKRYQTSRPKAVKPVSTIAKGHHPNSRAALLTNSKRRRAPKQAAKPKPPRVALPKPTGTKGIERHPMSVIKRIAAAEGVLILSDRDWQRFNDLREKQGMPLLYLPVTNTGRPML